MTDELQALEVLDLLLRAYVTHEPDAERARAAIAVLRRALGDDE